MSCSSGTIRRWRGSKPALVERICSLSRAQNWAVAAALRISQGESGVVCVGYALTVAETGGNLQGR